MSLILFRGKRIDNGEWVEGWLMKYEYHKMYIHCYYPCPVALWKQHEIQTETIGQFTGLTDKMLVKIFEGDILKYTKHPGYSMKSCLMTICFDRNRACFGYQSTDSIHPDYIHPFSDHDELDYDVLNHCKIIGNIHDNPELIIAAKP